MTRTPTEGEMIVYRTFGGTRRAVRVTQVLANVKNGFPGFDGEDHAGNQYWGYSDQILPENEAHAWLFAQLVDDDG